jgi:hypothetical protein
MIVKISQTLDLEMTDIIEITDEVSGTGNTDSVTCIVCQKPASNAHSCSKCSNTHCTCDLWKNKW